MTRKVQFNLNFILVPFAKGVDGVLHIQRHSHGYVFTQPYPRGLELVSQL